MAKIPITIMGFRCERCEHEWIPRNGGDSGPKVCPSCKSPYWDTPRKKPATSYDEFRDRIKKVLLDSGRPLSWTEVRTTAKLPQVFPNNKWVRRMEAEIGLAREKDKLGIIHWSITSNGGSSAPTGEHRTT